MSDEDTITKALREAGPRYIVDSHQQFVGFVLTPEEYQHYLDLLRAETMRGAVAEDLTARLDQVYATESSALDPALLDLQLASVDQPPW